jgi:uncharacterized damage-inducible protein DinB
LNKQRYTTLFSYTSHTTEQMLTKAALLERADYYAPSIYGHRSIHDLFFHMLATAHSWRVGLESGQQPSRLQAEEYPSLESIREGFAAERKAWHTLLEGLSDEEIDGPVALTNFRGDVFSMPYWRVFEHLVLHGMQHHTELAQLLTDKGHSPGDIDFLFYRD